MGNRRAARANLGGLVVVSGLTLIVLVGCDYWPPALQAQIERLRVDVQKVSDERVRLENELQAALQQNRDLAMKVEELIRLNREQHSRIASLEQSLAMVTGKGRVARGQSRPASSENGSGARTLQLSRPHLQGDDVRELQEILRTAGFAVALDGIFGPSLETAVRRFQRQQGLTPDGVVGPETQQALARINDRNAQRRVLRLTRPHMQGLDVKAVQQALRQADISIAVDGVFGPNMDTAVRRFQKNKGLAPDGIVGPGTWSALGL